MRRFIVLLVVLAVAYPVVPLVAQPPGGFGGGGPGGMGMMGPGMMGPGMMGPGMMGPGMMGSSRMGRGGTGRGGWSGRFGRRNDPRAAAAQQIETALRRFDTNGDGSISPNEVDLRQRAAFDKIIRGIGLDPNGSVSLSDVRDAVRKKLGNHDPAEGSQIPGDESKDSSKSSDAPKLSIRGFGVETKAVVVPGFGTPLMMAQATTAPPSSGSSTSSGSSSSSGSSGSSSSGGSSSGSSGSGAATSTSAPSSSGSSTSGGSSSDASPSPDAKIRRYAESLMKQHDKNGNGVLDGDEVKGLSSSLRSADRNSDGTITIDELTTHLSDYGGRKSSHSHGSSSSEGSSKPSDASSSGSSTGGSSRTAGSGTGSSPGSASSGSPSSTPGSSSSPSTGSTSSSSSSSSGSGTRYSSRFRTAKERLPSDLPSWFGQKDANEDGQVSMAEYVGNGTEDEARKFVEWDLNGDGIITAEEVQRKSSGKR